MTRSVCTRLLRTQLLPPISTTLSSAIIYTDTNRSWTAQCALECSAPTCPYQPLSILIQTSLTCPVCTRLLRTQLPPSAIIDNNTTSLTCWVCTRLLWTQLASSNFINTTTDHFDPFGVQRTVMNTVGLIKLHQYYYRPFWPIRCTPDCYEHSCLLQPSSIILTSLTCPVCTRLL